MSTKEQWLDVMRLHGGKIANKVNKILLSDSKLKPMQPALDYVSKSWFDPLTPAMMSLACEAVGGNPKDTHKAATAFGMINLSINTWDDLIDNDTSKLFKPTLLGKFGEPTSLIVGALSLAKANSILLQANIPETKLQAIDSLIWKLWTKMATAEIRDCAYRTSADGKAKHKLQKIIDETIYLESCLKTGAIIGDGSHQQVRHLGAYGRHLGLILELAEDFRVSVNLTLELTRKIETEDLSYSMLWASEQSPDVKQTLDTLLNKRTITARDIKKLTLGILETNVLIHIEGLIKKSSQRAIEELCSFEDTCAKKALEKFVGDQPRLFMGSLSAFTNIPLATLRD